MSVHIGLPRVTLADSEVVTTDPAPGPAPDEVVLAIDVGGLVVHTAVVGADRAQVDRRPTEADWNVERLAGIAAEVHAGALADGLVPRALVVAVPGQVDERHGAVQYSATLPWHDVPVADRVAAAVPVPVTVRHTTRAAALAEAVLGAAAGEASVLYVSVGAEITAAGAQSGVVVADRVGAGDLGRIRIRSGPAEGRALVDVASAPALVARFAQATGADAEGLDAADVHQALDRDPAARAVWDEAVGALADGLEWATLLYAPGVVVIGGGLARAGEDLLGPLRAETARRLAGRPVPEVRAARFADASSWVGAALTGWRRLGWPEPTLVEVLTAHLDPAP